jgi:predicted phage gp36 major capsid-like protein
MLFVPPPRQPNRYIKERKEALQKEQEARAAAKHSDCPIGHVPVPDTERKHTLGILKKSIFHCTILHF